MSLDLYTSDFEDRRSQFGSTQTIDPGVFTNFLSGAGKTAMQTFAQGARALTLAGGGLVSAVERLGEFSPLSSGRDTSLSDAIWKFHDEVSQRAVDYWTPSTGEVGMAGQVVGQLVATLPMVIASPAATVAATQLGTAEDLQRKGVESGTAQAVGAVQAAGLGLGIWMPILGKTLAQRVLVGGAGFNAVQGAVTRGISGAMLEDTPAAKDFEAFDPAALTLDVLLGAAFGGITHLSARQRAEGAAMWDKVTDWAKGLKPSDVEALATLRQAQHLNVDTLPGRAETPADMEAHFQRMKASLEQLLTDKPVAVDDMPAGRFQPDAAKVAEAESSGRMLTEIAKQVRVSEGLPLIVYHGSPHVFDRFDMTKIGTGEGAQVFGHGLYFAESPGTADFYRQSLSTGMRGSDAPKFASIGGELKGVGADVAHDIAEGGMKALDARLAEVRAAINDTATYEYEVKTFGKAAADDSLGFWKRELESLANLKATGDLSLMEGNLYRVEVPREAVNRMLDWDKPIGEQPEAVQKFLEELPNKPTDSQTVGEWLQPKLREGMSEYWTDDLKKAGVPGIKYLDGNSRLAGDGTRNFVLFDESLARIIDRNGEAIRTGEPPTAGSVEPPRNAEAPLAGSTARSPDTPPPDPLSFAADRVATQYPDARFDIEIEEDGVRTVKSMSAQEYLATIRADAAKAQQDVQLFEVAAVCLFGKG